MIFLPVFSRFSSLFAARDVSRGGRAKRPPDPGGEEGGETDVFADYSYMCSFLTASSSVPS